MARHPPAWAGELLSPNLPKRILVIEDHEDSAQALCLVLQGAGHTVEAVDCGLAGVDAARRFRPDVILCDLSLPDIDGLEVARRIRADAQLAGVWLIALTAYYVPDLAFAAGFDEYMTKPADYSALAKRVLETPSPRH